MEEILFEKEYEVHSYDSNSDSKLSLFGLFSYLQDIAGRHASILNFGRDDLLRSNKFWALSRIICKIERLPLWNETVKLRTWPLGIDGIFAIRNYQILDSKNLVIAEASSSWIILDGDSRRPVRPDTYIENLKNAASVENFSCRIAKKLPPAGSGIYRSELHKVKYSDLDINMHVNNAKYIQWVVDSYPLEYIKTHEAREVEVNYLAEVTPGDEYNITAEEKEEVFYHSVVKDNMKREACRVRIKWLTCSDAKVY